MTTYRNSSSFRVRPIEETLEIALPIARSVGVARITDTTRLDRVGLPVFAGIRPIAQPGSLCVTAGKGLTTLEAKAGATMESIELAFAEHERNNIAVIAATGRDVLDGATRPEAIFDLCPLRGARIDPNGPIDCVEAVDPFSGERALVPAECVIYPLPRTFTGQRVFGGDGNGLCSGNTFDEALVHGLAEVIERDVCAFHNEHDESILVANTTLPDALRELVERLEHQGFSVWVRAMPNEFELPTFMAVIRERGSGPLHTGYGTHPIAAIAATRAVCEACQSRLTIIHGGRDDLTGHFSDIARVPEAERKAAYDRLDRELSRESGAVDFASIRDRSALDLDSARDALKDALIGRGFSRVLTVSYTTPDHPIQVIRVMVPRLEVSNYHVDRRGARLLAYARQIHSP